MVSNGQNCVRLGDKIVSYHDNFRLYLVTYHPTPDFSSELSSKVNLIDFGITPPGLEVTN